MASWDLPALAPVDTTPTEATLWWTQEPPSSSTAPLVPRLGPRDEGSAAAAAVMQPPPSCRSSGLSSAPTEGDWPVVHAWLVEAVRRRLLGPALQAYLAAPERRSQLREESFLKAFWEREKRRPEAALGAASEFLMIEQMRQELAERALPRKVLACLTLALTLTLTLTLALTLTLTLTRARARARTRALTLTRCSCTWPRCACHRRRPPRRRQTAAGSGRSGGGACCAGGVLKRVHRRPGSL